MASLYISKQFTALHGTTTPIEGCYSVTICVSGKLILGWVNHIDSSSIENALELHCKNLHGKHLDEELGFATHENIAMYFMNIFHKVAEKIILSESDLKVVITKDDWMQYSYFSYQATQIGIRKFRLGYLDDAEKHFSDAINEDANNPQPYLLRGRVYRYKGHYKKALKDFNMVIHIDSAWSEGYRNKGNALLFLERYDKMLPFFDIAVSLAPNSSLVANNRGYALFLLGRYNEALTECLRAIDINPDYSEAYLDAANAYERLGDIINADALRQKAEIITRQIDSEVYSICDSEDYKCYYQLV